MLPHSGPHNGKSGVSLNTITDAWHLAARLKYQCHYINYYKKCMSPLAGLQSTYLYDHFLYSYSCSREKTEARTHLDGLESVVPAQGGRFCFGSARLDICEHSDRAPMRNKTKRAELGEKRRSWLGFIPTLERFVCRENTTDPATETNSLDMSCLAKGGKTSPVSMDDMVSYL